MFLVVQSKNLCPVFKGYDYVLQMFFFFFFLHTSIYFDISFS